MKTSGQIPEGNGLERNILGMVAMFLITSCFAVEAWGGEQPAGLATPRIRYAAVSPAMDGKLDDPAWEKSDILTGFTVPEAMNIARDQSEVRIVFDENRMYLGLKAYESSTNLMAGKGDSAFSSDNFEIFIQPDPDKDTYYQIAVSAAGSLYTAKGRSPAWKPAIELKTAMDKKCWIVELAIPFADLGMTAPLAAAERKIRFNICRNDFAEPGMNSKASASSFAILSELNFHRPEIWSDGIMTRETGEPRAIANKSPLINLLVNPEFDLAENNYPIGWNFESGPGDVSRQETMAMSGEWIVKTSGNAYVFLKQWVCLDAGKTYTARIKARRFGDCALGFGQIIKRGTDYPMTPILWECPLTTEFSYYHVTFKPVEDNVMLIFYRMGPHTNTDGIDIASVHLYDGIKSSFEIRTLARGGLNKPIEGTELPLPPNVYGVKAEKSNVLAIASSVLASREYLEIFAGLNVEADIIITTGKNQDTYYTDNNPDSIKKRLDDNKYELYMIGHNAINGPGEALAKKISANVEQGAGLVMNAGKERGNFKELLAKHKPLPVAANHYLKTGLPVSLYPQTNNPIGEIMEAQAGEGRIVVTSIGGDEFTIPLLNDAYGSVTFPHQRYSSAWLARLIYWVAGKSQLVISDASFDNGKVSVNCKGAIIVAELKWRLEDKNGKPVADGTVEVKDSQASVALPPMTLAGLHALSMWLQNGDGAVLDYTALTVKNEGPEITACESAKEFYTGTEEGEFTATIKGSDENMNLEWALEDFAGRTLQSGRAKAAETVKFNVPLNAVYTGLARLRVYLRSGKKELDAQRLAVFLPDRDKPRMLNDFNVSAWPAGQTPYGPHAEVSRQLERIGVRAQIPFTFGPVQALNDGVGVGAHMNLGDVFCSLYPSKNNIRQPSVSDPVLLKRLEDGVKKNAKALRKYGFMSAMIVDEAEDASRSGMEEIDAHPESLKEYRKRMQVKYGTIERFNKKCLTDYKSFDEPGIVLTKDARARENFAEFVEWRNYNVDRWVEALRLCVDSYHSQARDVPVSLANTFGPRALGCNDYWKLLMNTGFGFSCEYTSMVYLGDSPVADFDELYRSFRPDMRVWGWIGYYWSKQHAAFEPWWFALHRYGGFSFYAATGASIGSGSWNLLDIPGLGLAERGRLLQEGLSDSKLLDGLGKVFLEYDWKKRDIAVLYSQPSMLVAWCRGTETGRDGLVPGSPYRDWHYSRHGVRYMLEELLYQYDFISPEQIQQGVLDSYKALALPHIEALSDTEVKLVKSFMEKGGTVITDIMPATYDELGAPRQESPFKEMKDDKLVVFDTVFNSKDAAQREKMFKLLKERGVEPIVRCDDAPSTFGREAMRFVKDGMNVYAITRNFTRSEDAKEQTFTFPCEGHLYDLREGKYLGKTNQVTCAIPNAGTKVYGHYPYQVTGLELTVPDKVQGGKDLTADIKVNASTGKAGHHVFHIEVVPPSGEDRWFMKRNIAAPEGYLNFVFRMAENDPKGAWTLRATDVMTGTTATKNFILQ